MQSLKLVYDATNSIPLELLKASLEKTGKFIVFLEKEQPFTGIKVLGEYLFNPEMRTLQWKKDKPLPMTLRENKIFILLLKNAGTVVQRRLILSSFWDDESAYASRSLDLFICRIRKKLQKDLSVKIHTIRSEGFMLTY